MNILFFSVLEMDGILDWLNIYNSNIPDTVVDLIFHFL